MSNHRPSFRPAILRYFEANESRNVYIDELAQAIGATRDQTQAAVSNLRASLPDIPLKVVVPGNVWMYDRSAAKPAVPVKRVFEEIGSLKSGEILIQDGDGALYRASEM
jgi:hypothetical protein